MVATRRGAHTGSVEEAEMEDATLNLREKPVRKATAAKAATATKPTTRPAAKPTPIPASKARTTRSRTNVTNQTAEPEPQDASAVSYTHLTLPTKRIV